MRFRSIAAISFQMASLTTDTPTMLKTFQPSPLVWISQNRLVEPQAITSNIHIRLMNDGYELSVLFVDVGRNGFAAIFPRL